jgi:hypothetical protein
MPKNDEFEIIPDATPPGGDQREQDRPGKGATLSCPNPYSFSLALSVLLFANLFASALASERSFHALFLTGFQVKGVALNFLDDVFLLHFALETAKRILEGFALLQSNFRQTNTPPNPSGRTE